MNTLVPIDQARSMISPAMRQRMEAGQSLNKNFSDGVRDAFPLLSIKGKVFRARVSGEETAFLDPNTRQPLAFLDVVLVNGSNTLSKAYYAKGYTEGDMDPPTCWSLDSFKPDPSVANKQSVTCQNCPMNVFGSRTTESGKQAKACQDARRVAVVMPYQLDTTQQMLLLLRIPQSSLKNLKAYAQLLERNGFEASGCITRLAFDYQEAFPKLQFNFVAPLNDLQYSKVIELANDDATHAMLSAPDFDPAVSTPPQANATAQGLPAQGAVLLAKSDPMQSVVTPLQQPVQQKVLVMEIVDLPDGRRFDPNTGEFIEPEPEPEASGRPATVIELPDGKLFDTATKTWWEPPAEPEPVVEDDPATIKLPDGKFFNPQVGGYVTGPEKGAPLTAELKPVKEEKPKRQQKPKDKPPQTVAVAASTNGQAEMQLQQEQPQEDAQVQEQPQDENPNGVSAAPQSLEALLTKIVPPSA